MIISFIIETLRKDLGVILWEIRCWSLSGALSKGWQCTAVERTSSLTYHHFVNWIHYMKHFLFSYITIIIQVIQLKSPWKKNFFSHLGLKKLIDTKPLIDICLSDNGLIDLELIISSSFMNYQYFTFHLPHSSPHLTKR